VNKDVKLLSILAISIFLLAGIGCGPSGQKPKTEPQPAAEVPDIEALRAPVAKDPGMYKVVDVIKEYGQFKKKYISFEKYKKLTAGQQNGALDPDWFYDSYNLDTRKNDHDIKVTFGTSKRAKDRDPRIQKVMADLPEKSISVKLKTPDGRSYLLSDANADGILDYAADANKKTAKIDVKLLDTMQEKYTWIVGILKKYYKKK
jgi:hypothetical protein